MGSLDADYACLRPLTMGNNGQFCSNPVIVVRMWISSLGSNWKIRVTGRRTFQVVELVLSRYTATSCVRSTYLTNKRRPVFLFNDRCSLSYYNLARRCEGRHQRNQLQFMEAVRADVDPPQ